MNRNKTIDFDAVPLLRIIDKKLIDLLKSLSHDEWQRQTVAKLWKVKDVVAHLLDGNVRILSMLRDKHRAESPDIKSYQDLLDYLNGLNADWVKAMRRVSPEMLILLHEATGKEFCDYYASLNPLDTAQFSVAWAGESESKNWMHIAREYTEKFLHQQQIRDAVGKPGIMTREFFYPFIDILILALPYTYRDVAADNGTLLKLNVTGEIGGSWFLTRENNTWQLSKDNPKAPTSEISINPDDAWKLFSKSIRPEQIKHKVSIEGNEKLGEIALTMVSVMA
jgi:uncharacterized protein (TIGR03083 family)